MLIQRADVLGRGVCDVRVRASEIVEVAPRLEPDPGEQCLDAAGGALLPGLHDHHIHLFACAAALESVVCGPPAVRDATALAAALERPAGDGSWVRGVGYHESVAGDLDRGRLDGWLPSRPLRIQHRTGALWIVNSAGVDALGLDTGQDAPGVQRDASGRATGRLFDLDGWLRGRWNGDPPALAAVGRLLSRCGVTGVTDASPGNDDASVASFAAAVRSGALPVRVLALGTEGLCETFSSEVARGGVKVLLAERRLPDFEALRLRIERAHAAERCVAVHCVTRAELVFASAAFDAAGVVPGDRIEHASVAPPDCVAELARLGLTVVTQPGFVAERGDDYARDVDPEDQPWLYRGRGFLDAGVPLAGGTDAPYGDSDPWRAIRAAVERRSVGGIEIGVDESLTPEEALALFTSEPGAPGARMRRVEVGSDADLCLLDRPWPDAREHLASDFVAATLVAGRITYRRAV